MIDVIEISEENQDEFLPILGQDLADDVGRVYYNGLGVMDSDDNPIGALVYELLNSESEEEDTKGRICLAKSDDNETLKELSEYYRQKSVSEYDIIKSFFELEDEKSAKVLAESGFSLKSKEDDSVFVTLDDIGKTDLAKKKKLPEYVGNIEELSVLQFRDAVKTILFKGHKGILEDVAFLPKNWYDNKISACATSGGVIQGMFLIRRTPSGILFPVLFFAYGPDSRMHLLHMLRYATRQALELYPGKTRVMISRRTDAIRALTAKLLPGRSGKEIFYGSRREQ